MDEYSIENLCKTFSRHAEDFEKHRYKPNDLQSDSFNISRALKVICEELRDLKRKE